MNHLTVHIKIKGHISYYWTFSCHLSLCFHLPALSPSTGRFGSEPFCLGKKKQSFISLQRAIIWKAYTCLGHVSILNSITVTRDMESL